MNEVNKTYIIKLLQHSVHFELGRFAVINAESFCFFIVCFIHFLKRGGERKREIPNTHYASV